MLGELKIVLLNPFSYRNQLQYLVDWEGYPPSERSWEPARGLADNSPPLREAIAKFHDNYPDKPIYDLSLRAQIVLLVLVKHHV